MKKLTVPQQYIMDRLNNGDKIEIINAHHMNGGRWQWTSDKQVVYTKTFWNLMHTLYGFGTCNQPAQQYFAK